MRYLSLMKQKLETATATMEAQATIAMTIRFMNIPPIGFVAFSICKNDGRVKDGAGQLCWTFTGVHDIT